MLLLRPLETFDLRLNTLTQHIVHRHITNDTCAKIIQRAVWPQKTEDIMISFVLL